jgi:hypothetical protein
MKSRWRGSPLRERQARDILIAGDLTMLTLKAKLIGKLSVVVGLTAIAAIFVSTAGITPGAAASAKGQHIVAQRATAIHDCNVLANRYTLYDWGNTQIHLYRTCMAARGQQE